MLNTFSRLLIIWELAIETWAQEMNGGPGNELGGPESWTAAPPWKLYFKPCLLKKLLIMLDDVRLTLRGQTVIFSIHQPRFAIFKLFDRLSLLADGRTVYHGNASEALNFFQSIGMRPNCWFVSRPFGLYSASALLAMQTAVIARGFCLSATFRCFVQTNEDTIVRFSALGRAILPVSGEVKFIRIFAKHHPLRGR